MLGNPPFYHQTLRRTVIAFGSMFKDIEMIKYHKTTREELERVTVPLTYGGKENFLTRLGQDPDTNKGVALTFPQMSFEMDPALIFDNERLLSGQLEHKLPCNTAGSIQFAVPYIVRFNLYVYIRNVEDGNQIVEQILPFFAPTQTLTLKYVTTDCCDVVEDIPFTLKNVTFDNDYEGNAEKVRSLVWTLSFEAKIQFYGPVNSSRGVIREAIVNIRSLASGNVNATINVQPDPITANANDDYGYTTTITEYLDTL